nr:MAG TPA: hypothetical protein [Caudoviricetes sp.]
MCGHWVWVRGPFWQRHWMFVQDAGCFRHNYT